jgi:hypothetical protein
VPETLFQLQGLAYHLLGTVEVLGLAVEQAEIAGGNRSDADLLELLGHGEALEQHLLSLRELAEALQ